MYFLSFVMYDTYMVESSFLPTQLGAFFLVWVVFFFHYLTWLRNYDFKNQRKDKFFCGNEKTFTPHLKTAGNK